MAISLLTPLSTPPGRSQDDFDTAMATTLAEIDTMVDQLNLALDAINTVLPNLDLVPGAAAAAATATAARDVVLAARDVVLQARDTTLTARDVAVAAASSIHLPPVTAADAGKSMMVDGSGELMLGFAATAMVGATASSAGVAGLAPAPAAGDQTKFLSAAGDWREIDGGLSMARVTGSTTLAVNTIHRCYLAAAATLALPASPGDGDYLEVWDCGRTFDAHAVVVSGSVRGDAEGMMLDDAGSRMAYIYDATTATWQDSSVLGG